MEKCYECGCLMIEKHIDDKGIWFRCRNGYWKCIENVGTG